MSANILIVEDEGIVAKELEKRLNRLGYQVAGTVATGEAAVKSALLLKPDLILMDIRLSGPMDGIETAHQINLALDVPIVYLTAYADPTTVQRATEAHAYGYILKPFREQDLSITTELALHQHRKARELTEKVLEVRDKAKTKGSGAGNSQTRYLEALAENLAALNQIEENKQAFSYQLLHSVIQLASPEANGVILFELNSQTGQFELQQQLGIYNVDKTISLALDNPLIAQIISNKKGLAVSFTESGNQSELQFVLFGENPSNQLPRSVLLLPLLEEEQVTALVIGYTNELSGFNSDTQALLQTFMLLAGVSREKITSIKHKEEFLAMTAHDLRAPLAAIHLSAGILESSLTQQPQAIPLLRLVDNINRNSLRLRKLVDDLLDLNRLQQGCIQLHLESLEVGELVSNVITVLAALFEEKQQTVIYERPPAEYMVKADRQRLEQVLVNLLANANKYTPAKGNLAVVIKATQEEVWISISDNGPGIPLEEQAHIFDQFYRSSLHEADNSTSGSGLGLSIALHLVELHGGRLWLSSSNTDPARGATGSNFVIVLPLSNQLPALI